MAFDFEKEKLVRELKRINPKRVVVQLAEGIKQNSMEFARIFNDLGIEVIFSGETCWGACSPAIQEAQALGADLIVHFGHAEFMKIDFPILYIEINQALNSTKNNISIGMCSIDSATGTVNYYESHGTGIIDENEALEEAQRYYHYFRPAELIVYEIDNTKNTSTEQTNTEQTKKKITVVYNTTMD